jgi:hypothetical protein
MYKMTTLKDAIILKMNPLPTDYIGTLVLLDSDRETFPNRNQWRGDYTSVLPIIDPRTAGYRQVIDYSIMNINNKKYKLPVQSFQTGPSTTFSPWLKPYDTNEKQSIFIGATV